jgi:hypothetical protein
MTAPRRSTLGRGSGNDRHNTDPDASARQRVDARNGDRDPGCRTITYIVWSLWLIAAGWPCSTGTAALLDEALDERQRRIGDFAPAAVDRE